MKICPHCNSKIPDTESRCPSCGALYWEPDLNKALVPDETQTEKEQGCLSLLLLPFFLSLAVTASLICAGFLINLIIHFENNQIKIVWIGSSFLLGFLIYLLVYKIKVKKAKDRVKKLK